MADGEATDGSGTKRVHRLGAAERLSSITERFPRGLSLSREDLALIGWLHLYEETREGRGVSEAELRWLIPEALKCLGIEAESVQSTVVVQRLLRCGVLRVTMTESARRGYRLTCLGQNLARNLMEETDYSSEQLNALLGSALREVRSSTVDGGRELYHYLRHVFLGPIREKVEYKLLAIEEDLEERKREVRQSYSGRNESDFEGAIRNIGYCRSALTELVDAVQESSACMTLEEMLHTCIGGEPAPEFHEVLEQSLNFLYLLRGRVDAMLKDVVHFVHDCVAFRSLAFTVDSRYRLCRIQEEILMHALESDIRMPVLDMPGLPRLDLNWSRRERDREVVIDLKRLETLDEYRPPELPPVEPEWKEAFLDLARGDWKELSARGGVDLVEWLNVTMEKLPELSGNPSLAIWFLTQEWPSWSPPVAVLHRKGVWVPLGREWMVEAIELVPAELQNVIPSGSKES